MHSTSYIYSKCFEYLYGVLCIYVRRIVNIKDLLIINALCVCLLQDVNRLKNNWCREYGRCY